MIINLLSKSVYVFFITLSTSLSFNRIQPIFGWRSAHLTVLYCIISPINYTCECKARVSYPIRYVSAHFIYSLFFGWNWKQWIEFGMISCRYCQLLVNSRLSFPADFPRTLKKYMQIFGFFATYKCWFLYSVYSHWHYWLVLLFFVSVSLAEKNLLSFLLQMIFWFVVDRLSFRFLEQKVLLAKVKKLTTLKWLI